MSMTYELNRSTTSWGLRLLLRCDVCGVSIFSKAALYKFITSHNRDTVAASFEKKLLYISSGGGIMKSARPDLHTVVTLVKN